MNYRNQIFKLMLVGWLTTGWVTLPLKAQSPSNEPVNTVISTENTPLTNMLPPQPQRIWRSLGTMLVFLAALLAASYFIRKKAASFSINATKRIKVSERVSLGNRHGLALVNVSGRQFLVGIGPQSVTTVAELRDNPEIPENE